MRLVKRPLSLEKLITCFLSDDTPLEQLSAFTRTLPLLLPALASALAGDKSPAFPLARPSASSLALLTVTTATLPVAIAAGLCRAYVPSTPPLAKVAILDGIVLALDRLFESRRPAQAEEEGRVVEAAVTKVATLGLHDAERSVRLAAGSVFFSLCNMQDPPLLTSRAP